MLENARRRETFLSSVLGGLAAGVNAAAAIVVLPLFVAFMINPQYSLPYFPAVVVGLMPLAAIIMLVAAGLALFPIGPIWILTAWFLYAGRATSPWTYALAGALITAHVPLLPLVMSLGTQSDYADALAFVVWFALSGGIGGYVSGRSLQRTSAH